MQTGTVKWFNINKGYGFIKFDNGDNDIFVHIGAVEKAGYNSLEDGQKVSFEIALQKGKQSAVNIKKLAA